MKTKLKTKVTWKEPEHVRVRPLLPHPFVSGVTLSPAAKEMLAAAESQGAFAVGSLWQLTSPVMVDSFTVENGYQQHPHRYLFHSYHHLGAQFSIGQLAVYAGKVRVSEVNTHGQTIRIERDSFFIKDTIYMVVDFNCFAPVQSSLGLR